MNYQLLWIDALLISLLWVAAIAAITGRLHRKWVRGILFPIIVGPPLFVLVAFVYSSAVMRFADKADPNWFVYALSLLSAYITGTSLILCRGRKAGLKPATAAWPRLPLLFALLVSIAVGYMTLLNMDLAIRARCAILDEKIGLIYVAATPAIVSESQNAAPLYEQAFKHLKNDPGTDIYNPPLGDRKIFDPNDPATVAFLKRHAETLALLHRAAALPGCRFDSDLGDPDMAMMNALFDSLNVERQAANVLDLDAREQLARENPAAAINDADSILKMSRQFTQRPMLISGLVGIGIDAVGNKTLEEALPAVKNCTDLTALHLDELPSLGRMFQQSFRGEERFGLNLYATMPPERPQDLPSDPNQMTNLLNSRPSLTTSFSRVFFLDLDQYLELMDDLQKDFLQPYFRVRDQLPGIGKNNHVTRLLTQILAPSLSRAVEIAAKAEASDECARIGVAMTLYRLDHGNLPSKLAELVPNYLDAIPTDPFDGKSLRLVIRNNTWIIFSVGANGIDNGGIDSDEMQIGKDDVTFKLKATPAPATTKR
jgi:hypothetical protein